jgi:hypothetical protein
MTPRNLLTTMLGYLHTQLFSHLPKPFILLVAAYFFTSLGHFAHNAEFICEYPNLPTWLTRAKVYAAWLAITAVGMVGLILIKNKLMPAGLLLVAVYAALWRCTRWARTSPYCRRWLRLLCCCLLQCICWCDR